MVINPGIPIPSAIPREVSLERPFNGADDDDDVDVEDCMVDGVICEDNNVIADDITDEDPKLDKAVVEPKVSVGIVIFRSYVILKDADRENIQPPVVVLVLRNKKRNVFENVRLNP